MAGEVLTGSDLSAYQDGTYAGDDDFVGLKTTEGVGFMDPGFPRHLVNVRARPQRPLIGPYHFARPDLGNRPEGEADWFATVVEAHGGPAGMWPVLDLEVGSGSLWDWRDRFCARLEQRWSCLPWWYDYLHHIATHALNTPTPYRLWFAWPDENGPLPVLNCGPIRMQQYGLKTVPGIVGQVDANRYFGDRASLRALTVGGSAAPAPLSPTSSGGDSSMVQITGADGRTHRLIVGEPSDPDVPIVLDGEGNRGGEVHWIAPSGGPGGFLGWSGGDGSLGGWIAAGTLAASLWTWPDAPLADGGTGPRELLIIEGRGLDADTWLKAMYTDDFTIQQDWVKVASPRIVVPGAAPIPGPKGEQGAEGPPGPGVDDAHIASVALAAVSTATGQATR